MDYDQIGNPTSYRGATLAFNGRQLTSYTKGSTSISYQYDASGLRASKTVNGETTIYQYVGDKLYYEQRPDGSKLYFFYDSYGNLTHLYHHVGGAMTAYNVVTNSQGDVIALYNFAGNQLMASYSYDAWGNCTITQDTTGIGAINPIRYRGYYFDSEIGMYYLQSRYYDPNTGRFINADGYITTGQGVLSYNMYAYCGNKPVCRKDPSGQFWHDAIVAVGTVIAVVCTATLSWCSIQPSPPSNYVQENSTNQNCYSYAFGLPHSANPGDYSVSDDSDYMFKDKNIYTPEEITDFIERDMKALNKSVRVVDSPKDKLDNEYIVAMKTSTIVIPSIGVADYHFAVQLSDGSWSDKPGQTPSRWNALDGTAIAWDLGNIKNYYNTASVYFAVER